MVLAGPSSGANLFDNALEMIKKKKVATAIKGILCQLYFVLVVRVSKGFKCTGHEEFF